MDSIEKLVSDFSSWYWWVSVVIVGMVINLLSAYLKQPLDRWWERRSEQAQETRMAKSDAFSRSVDRISSDSTLLVIWGQRLHTSEVATSMAFTLWVVTLPLMLLALQFDYRPEVREAVSAGLALLAAFIVVYLFVQLKRHKDIRDVVFAARAMYASNLRKSRTEGVPQEPAR